MEITGMLKPLNICLQEVHSDEESIGRGRLYVNKKSATREGQCFPGQNRRFSYIKENPETFYQIVEKVIFCQTDQ